MSVPLDLLPKKTLNVLEFLRLEFPPTVLAATSDLSAYISTDAPSITSIKSIERVPVPPASIVKALDKWLSENHATSIKIPHTSDKITSYPPWIIAYWRKLIDIRAMHKTWSEAVISLRQQSKNSKASAAHLGVISQAHDALSCIPWTGNVYGFSTSYSSYELAPFCIPTKWLNDEQLDMMLELLEDDLARAEKLLSVRMLSILQAERLASAYQKSTDYWTLPDYRHFRSIAQSLVDGITKRVAWVAHKAGSHWAAFVIDLGEAVIYHGDSLGWAIEDRQRKSIEWWMSEHTDEHFTWKALPITRQSDGCSCGLLAWNALACFLLDSSKDGLLSPDKPSIAEARYDILLRIIRRHSISVCNNSVRSLKHNTQRLEQTEPRGRFT
jgi:hypothetical protein